MAITRRQFIQRTGLAAAGSFLGPSLFRNPWLQQALADTMGDRYFVVLYLDGGNDGLNTITPFDNGTGSGSLRDDYQIARKTGSGGLQLPTSGQGALLVPTMKPFNDPATTAQLGFHPGLQGIKNLYEQSKVAVIQGCGYPDYSLSHDDSRHFFQNANPQGNSGFLGGWLGRYLAANYLGSDIPGVNIRDDIAGEFIQFTTSVLAFTRVRNFKFPYDNYDHSDDSAKKTAFLTLCSQATASAQATLKYVGDTGTATEKSTESYPQLENHYKVDRPSGSSWDDKYSALGTSTAKDLREVAKVIYGVSTGFPLSNPPKARFFEVRNGGYDTHSDQGVGFAGDQHYDLHREVGDAVEMFYNDCVDMGVGNKIVILVWSEFSRRIKQNDNGTDHGSQGPMFVIGGPVIGGVYGNHPNIKSTPSSSSALDGDGNTVYWQGGSNAKNWTRSTDIRDVYGTILNKWLGMADPSTVLPVDVGSANLYWTSPNFNMGFL